MGQDKQSSSRRVAIGVCSGLLGLFLADAAVFRSSLYLSVVDPDSTGGALETKQYMETHRIRTARPQVVAFGDSRMGFLPHFVTQAPGTELEFGSPVIPGSSPRCWYYQLRDLDPDSRHYDAVVLPVDDYDDEDREVDPADLNADINYTIGRLRLTDVFDFSMSFESWRFRWAAFRGSILKSTVYKDDFQAFLLTPSERLKKARQFRMDYPAWYRNFGGDDRSVGGVTVDWVAGTLHVPPGTSPSQEQVLRDVLLRPASKQTGRLAVYRRKWFGRIADRYRGTATKVILFRLPRGPILRPEWLVRKRSSSIRELASRPNVVLLDEHLFEPLERTSFFVDPLHLNATGMKRLSQTLADEIAALMRERILTAHAVQ